MDTALHSGLHGISLLFSYPDQQWAAAQLPLEAEPEAAKLLTEMRNANPWDIEAEYVRLFINAMPEVPCAPYGSVYLEGAVMGKTTVKVAGIFHYYGLNTEELADHIAVEAEFLAWLYGRQEEAEQHREHLGFLLQHLRKWTPAFFSRVEKYDRLGCYRRGAQIAQKILSGIR